MINKVMQEIIKLNHCVKSSADLSQIWAANEVLISKLGRNNSCHSLQRQPSFFLFVFFFLFLNPAPNVDFLGCRRRQVDIINKKQNSSDYQNLLGIQCIFWEACSDVRLGGSRMNSLLS